MRLPCRIGNRTAGWIDLKIIEVLQPSGRDYIYTTHTASGNPAIGSSDLCRISVDTGAYCRSIDIEPLDIRDIPHKRSTRNERREDVIDNGINEFAATAIESHV